MYHIHIHLTSCYQALLPSVIWNPNPTLGPAYRLSERRYKQQRERAVSFQRIAVRAARAVAEDAQPVRELVALFTRALRKRLRVSARRGRQVACKAGRSDVSRAELIKRGASGAAEGGDVGVAMRILWPSKFCRRHGVSRRQTQRRTSCGSPHTAHEARAGTAAALRVSGGRRHGGAVLWEAPGC